MSSPIISAVICTHNRAGYLRKAIRSLTEQSLPQERFEILIVDNCSTDTTKDIAEEFAKIAPVRYLYESELGLSHARNCGWRSAKGEYVAYLDDDAIASPEWLEKIIDAFEAMEPRPGCVGGKTEPLWEAPRPSWLSDQLVCGLSVVDWSVSPRFLEDLTTEWLVGANIAFPVNVLEAVGGFSGEIGRIGRGMLSGEEIFLMKQMMKAGYRCFYHPEIKAYHHINKSRLAKSWFRRRYYWQGESDAVMIMLEQAPSNTMLLRLAWSRIVKLLGSPRKLLDVVFSNNDPDRFTEACFALITLGQIRGLLAALWR